MTSILPGPEPAPPGQEDAHAGNADLAHAGNVATVTVKVPGNELARIWPDGTIPGLPDGLPPPVARFTATPPAPTRNQNVTLNGTGSAPGDPAAPITSYRWTFSDGTAAMTGATVTWKTPNKAGSFTVTLTVTASDGQAGQSSQTFTM